MSFEQLIVRQKVDRVRRALEAVANEARADKRLQSDIWTASSPTSTAEYLRQFDEARADLSSKFSAKLANLGGVQSALVDQTVKTVGGASTVKQPLVFLPPGTSATASQGVGGAQARWAGKRMNNAFHDADSDENAASSKSSSDGRSETGRRRTGRAVDTTIAAQSLSTLSGSEPTEMAAAVTVSGLFRDHDVLVTVPYYPLIQKPVQLTQCRSNPSSVAGNWPGSCGTVSRNVSFADGCGSSWSRTETRCNPCPTTAAANWPGSCGTVSRNVSFADGCGSSWSRTETRCNPCTVEVGRRHDLYYTWIRATGCVPWLPAYECLYEVERNQVTHHMSNSCGSTWDSLSYHDTPTGERYVWRDDGCFTPTTKIRLYDGSEREISKLRSGDMVWNPIRKRGMKISSMTVGPEEKPLLEIESGGHSVRVTEGHPMLVLSAVDATEADNGSLGGKGKAEARKAQDIVVGDLMLGVDGEYHPVTAVRILPVEAGQQVWNFRVATESQQLEDHVIEADGVPTGDLAVQGWLARSKG